MIYGEYRLVDEGIDEFSWEMGVVEIPAIITNCTELASIPSTIKTLIFADNACNDWISPELDLEGFEKLEKVEIGSNALNTVENVMLSNLPNLKVFNTSILSFQNCETFTVNNSPSLRKISIGDYSFNSAFVFNVDSSSKISLESIQIGSGCFQGNANSLSSLSFNLQSSSSLKQLHIGSQSFSHFNNFNINGIHYYETMITNRLLESSERSARNNITNIRWSDHW